jgi:hypothetical protein
MSIRTHTPKRLGDEFGNESVGLRLCLHFPLSHAAENRSSIFAMMTPAH